MAGRPRTNTNLNLYRSFIAVYETKSVRKAAEITGTTHSAVSQNLKELGRQLGVKLFHNQYRGMQPSGEAVGIYETVKNALDTLNLVDDRIKVFGKDSAGVIKIACTTNFAAYYLVPHIAKFRKEYANVQFDIFNVSTDDALAMLEKNQIDLVISIVPIEDSKKFRVNKIESFFQTFFTTKKFAEDNNIKSVISLEEFSDLPFMALRTFDYFLDRDFIKEPDVIVDTQEMLIRLFLHDVGVSFGIWKAAEEVFKSNDVVKFSIDGITPKDAIISCISLAKQDQTQMTRAFTKLLLSN